MYLSKQTIITSMDKFITQTITPIFQSQPINDQQILQEKLAMIRTQLKIFANSQIKSETANINKQLAKKSRELFILSSDNQSLKECLDETQDSLKQAKNQYNQLEQQKIKQKLVLERQIGEIKKEAENNQKQLKAEIYKIKNEKEEEADQHAKKIREIKRQHQKNQAQALQSQRLQHQTEKNTMKQEFEAQKTHIMNDNNNKKKQLIKKYEQKINKLTEDYENKIYLLQKQIKEDKQENSKAKGNLQDKIMKLESEINRLKRELQNQNNLHKKFEQDYKHTNDELMKFRESAAGEKQAIEQELHETKKKLYQEQRKYIKDTTNLNKKLEQTIFDKDKKFTDTVETMETEHRIQVDSLRNQLLEQREIAVNSVEVQREKENYQHQTAYNTLKQEFDDLKVQYDRVRQQFEKKIDEMANDHNDYVESLNYRKQYELKVNDKNAQREFTTLKNMYDLQIKSIHEKHTKENAQMIRKFNDEKIGLTNKLTTQYQSMISDLRNSNQIQIKQKLIEFQRKAKGFEAKIKDAEKKKSELKAQIQRVKMQMQMRIDSMIQVTETLQEQIGNLNEKLQDLQRENKKIVNQYQLKILVIKNQMKQTKQQFELHEQQLKELLESKLKAKNQEITIIINKLTRETTDLITKNEERVSALQKQYNQLKKVLGQKTSLPEDIQALKIFHGAYIERQQQLQKQKKKVQYLKRQLMAKDAIDKVFAQKGQKIVFEADTTDPVYTTYQVFPASNPNKKMKSTLLKGYKTSNVF